MSNYPLNIYRLELVERANRTMGYNNPMIDQKAHQAITLAIDQKVEDLRRHQESELSQMIANAKSKL